MTTGQTVEVGALTSRITLQPGGIITVWNNNIRFRPATWFRLAVQLDPDLNTNGSAVEIGDTNDAQNRGGEVVWKNDDGTQSPAMTLVNRSNVPVNFEVNYLKAPG